MSVADRVGVIYEGEFVEWVDPSKVNQEQMGLYMAGINSLRILPPNILLSNSKLLLSIGLNIIFTLANWPEPPAIIEILSFIGINC